VSFTPENAGRLFQRESPKAGVPPFDPAQMDLEEGGGIQ
jgi:hypothetical protein